MAESFTKAFNAGDARAVAALHTPDACVVDVTGEVAEGRDAVEREYAGLFRDNPGQTLEVNVDDLRLVGPDVAVEEGTTRVTPKGRRSPGRQPLLGGRCQARRAVAPGERPRIPGRAPSAHDRLRELEWMLGEWVDEAPDSVILSTCRWSDDKQALNRECTVREDGRVAMTVIQRIGWDPAGGQIRSWEFDSEGGHGEGLWARLGGHWVVKATGVLRTAERPPPPMSSRGRTRPPAAGGTVDRTVGGDVIPVADEFVMVRRPPPPQSK